MYRTLFTLVCLAASPLSTAHAQWGTLTGTFVYDGDPPNPAPIVVTKDIQVCGKHNLVDESVSVNPTNKGIAGIVVSLYVARRGKQPDVHPSYEETADAEVRLDNLNCRFEPHIVLLRTGQTLVVGNKDPIGHNTKIDTLSNVPINPIIPANGEIKQKFPKEERLPVLVSCSIHPWMNARVVIKESPYMAVTDENGKFAIENLPEGDWEFQVWHESSGYVDSVKVGGKSTKWTRGRTKQTIGSGTNDLGQILVPPAAFKK
jgi:hypothetical protein